MKDYIKIIIGMIGEGYINSKFMSQEGFDILEAEVILIAKKKSFLSVSQRRRIENQYEQVWRDF